MHSPDWISWITGGYQFGSSPSAWNQRWIAPFCSRTVCIHGIPFFLRGVSGPVFWKFLGCVIFGVALVFGSQKSSSFFNICIQNFVLDTIFQSPCQSFRCLSRKMLDMKSRAPLGCSLVHLNKRLRGFYLKIYGKDKAQKSFQSSSYGSNHVEVPTICAEGAKASLI